MDIQKSLEMLGLKDKEVAAYVAERHYLPVYGVDLQAYSVVLAEAIIGRDKIVVWEGLWERWNERARRFARDLESHTVPKAPGHNRDSVRHTFVLPSSPLRCRADSCCAQRAGCGHR